MQSHFPNEVNFIIECHGKIWLHEDESVEKKLSAAERLCHHRQYSLPMMAQIRQWGNHHLVQGNVQENSGLGKTIHYFDKHDDGLTSIPGMKEPPWIITGWEPGLSWWCGTEKTRYSTRP
ncbi:hypothetical protein SG34_032575 [Thalassomonas viridans]|uniref:Uncharacterized protein n=1 Tax=Thalassomonas viridans TaxID=137584 RepID=A0AAF0CEA9_9GAMM|nr:hypothetical protein SG34_032575 [Thalassomonas viridans]